MSKVNKQSYLVTPAGSFLCKCNDRDEADTKAKDYARKGINVEIYEKLTTWTPDRVRELDKAMKGADA